MAIYEDLAEELTLTAGETVDSAGTVYRPDLLEPIQADGDPTGVGSRFSGESIQPINMRAPAFPAGRFDFPTDFHERWKFDEGLGNYVDPVSGNADLRLIGVDSVFVEDQMTGGFAGMTKDKGQFSANTTAFSSVGYNSGYYPANKTYSHYFWRYAAGGTLSMWIEADWPNLASQSCAVLFSNTHEGSYGSTYAGYWRPYVYSSGTSQRAQGINLHHYYGIVYATFCLTDLGSSVILSTSVIGLSAGYHNFVPTFDGRYFRLYVDGELKDEVDKGTYGWTIYYGSSTYYPRMLVNMAISTSDTSAYWYSGIAAKYRDICIWRRYLNPTEIKAVFNEAQYGPGATVAMQFNDVAAYGDIIVADALVESFLSMEDIRADSGAVLVEFIDTYGWIGSGLNGSSSTQYHDPLTERVTANQVIDGLRAHCPVILDIFSNMAEPDGLRAVIGNITEDFDMRGVLSSLETLVALELVRMDSNPNLAGSKFSSALSAGITVKSIMTAAWIIALQEGIDLSDTSSWKSEWFINLIENVNAASSLFSTMHATSAIAIAISILESTDGGKGVAIEDSFDITEAILSRAMLVMDELIKVTVSDSHEITMLMAAPITEELNISDDMDLAGILQSALNDGITFQITFGVGEALYTGYVMNTESFGVSQYSNFPFSSFMKINGSYFGTNSSGLYQLEGDSDDGEAISAKVMLGKTDFDSAMKSGVAEAYIGMRSDGEVILKVVTDDNIERWYHAHGGKTNLDDARFKLMRGVKSNYWQIGFENMDGSDFELSEIELVRVLMSRR